MVRTGALETQCEAVLFWLRKHPGLTSAELAKESKLDRHLVARRLPNLLEQGAARKGTPRMCGVGVGRAVTWWPSSRNRQKGLFE